YRHVVEVLETLRSEPTAVELRGEAEAVAAIAAGVAANGERSAVVRPSRGGRPRRAVMVAAAALTAGATHFTGLAAAHPLPRPAQHGAAQVLSNLGVHVPDTGPHPHSSPGAHGQTGLHAPSPVSTPPADGTNGSPGDVPTSTAPNGEPPVDPPADGGSG